MYSLGILSLLKIFLKLIHVVADIQSIPFYCLLDVKILLFCEMSVHVFCYLFSWNIPLLLTYRICLYILDINSLSAINIVNILLQSAACVFTIWML
jgi:hypothetical protein